jgi:hypothetical protein
MLKVQQKQCATCIFNVRFWSKKELSRFLVEIKDPHMRGHYYTHRICHHSKDAVCAKFWAQYKDRFNVGQIAQRLNLVEYVDHDISL